MSLFAALTRAKTEEDIKDAYIKALGLKNVFKGLVDIQTPEIWFEAKETPTNPLLMFAQLLVYVRAAHLRGEALPGFLGVCDRDKAALMPTEHALPIIKDPAITWPKSGSKADLPLASLLQPHLEPHFTLYPIIGMEADFITATKDAIREGRIIRTPITPDNLRQVFDKWVAMIGVELGVKREADYAVLFFADIMHDGKAQAMQNLPARLLFNGDTPVFIIGADQYDLSNTRGYYNFWNIYHRPPEQKHRHYLLERRDSLLPLDDQKFKGAFYTPFHIVDKAYDQLTATLGADWQDKYIVWDMCAGVGNLESKHSNLRNVFMSTLDAEDVTIMRSNPAFAGATIFQYDYLNDDVTDFGEIDYTISKKLPAILREAIAAARVGLEGAKPILVLINPPYGEASNSQGNAGKTGIATTRVSYGMNDLGYAARELFVQFLHRISTELPKAKLAMFSTFKYINAPNFEEFRARWNAEFLDGFAVHSKAFDGLKGNFPIGFLLWDLDQNQPAQVVTVRGLDKAGNEVGEKSFFDIPNLRFLSGWLHRIHKNSVETVPLINAVTPVGKVGAVRNQHWANGAIAHFFCNGNDMQNAGTMTAIFSSVHSIGHAGGYFVTEENLWKVSVMFTVRRVIARTWLNDRDQFLQPSQPLTDDFKSDCLVWMLFNGSNLTAGADGLQWDNRDWSLVNHFIPFTESQVGAKGRFESDFMVRYMAKLTFSPQATAVLDQGRTLWAKYHATTFPAKIRDEFKLNRVDAGWYQIRRALEAYDDVELTDFGPFKAAYTALTEKLRPQVFDLGFLPS